MYDKAAAEITRLRAEVEELRGLETCVHEQLDDGEAGFWQSCSGCYETSDGYNINGFPYSNIFRCILGGGCFECGGIGAVWDQIDCAALSTNPDGEG